MQLNKNNHPLTQLKQQFIFIVDKVKEKFNWTQIDQHQSLTFLNKNYHKKPSDIAKIIIILLGAIIFLVQGFRVLTILMCYVLPIGVMILKLCEVMKSKKQRRNYQINKEKTEADIQEGKIMPEKNDPSGEVKPTKGKTESEKSQQKQKNSSSAENDQNSQQKPSLTQLNKQFIFYFIINLILDLIQPLLLLIFQTLYNLLHLVFSSVEQLIFDGNIWPLILLPFQFIGKFIAHVATFQQVGQLSIVTLIIIRVVLAAILLNMSRQKLKFCQNLLYERNFSQMCQIQQSNSRPKTQ